MVQVNDSGIVLYMRLANERLRYIVTSLFGWAHAQNDSSGFNQNRQQPIGWAITKSYIFDAIILYMVH